ncbi:MAG: acyltransferase [Desulfobulbaceae bacterium]|nr:acyltransferase [Desulfobulbaceae bacterium]
MIDFLRFPMIIGVLLIHNASATVQTASGPVGSQAFLPIHSFCTDLFSQTLGRLAVPTFFFISGFLFFLHLERFNLATYRKKLPSRVKTLLIPYLFWNLLSVTVFSLAHYVPAFSRFFSKSYELTWQYVLQALWAIPDLNQTSHMAYPYAYQFWFIRDLMVMVMLTPVIYCFVKKLRLWGLGLLGILWFSEWWQALFPWLAGHGLSITALFFFTAGAWFSLNQRNVVDDAQKVAKWTFALYPLFAMADMLTKIHVPKQHVYLPFIHNSGILFGMAASFALAAWLLKTGRARVNAFLASASFFVFAVHDPWFLSKLRKAIWVLFRPESDIALTALYFLLVIVVTATALALYWLLRRFLPGFTRVITGGR